MSYWSHKERKRSEEDLVLARIKRKARRREQMRMRSIPRSRAK